MSKRQRVRSTQMGSEPMGAVDQHSQTLGNDGEAGAGSVISTCCSPEDRQQMIAIAAYFRAERRGFAPGYEMDDWLAAEAEIEKTRIEEP